ncbi:ATP-grasp domain-containing protein [Sorangium sp. So ce136]|uniref:ATP-grasp domain-containing protein n=1 Tax=Sorangium sp. So ce136 TaxID=3133284 RepID=UPI003F0A47E4
MANLLIVESWVRSVGLVLPRKLKELGHRFTFVTRKPEHYTGWARGAGLLAQGTGASAGEEHPMLGLADEVIVAETNDVSRLLDALRPLHAERRYDGVLTTCDYYLETAARVAAELGLPGTPPAALRVAREKHLMREACRRAGLPGPRFLATNDVDQAVEFARSIGFPVVVKAVDLCASEHVVAIHDADGLRAMFSAVSGPPVNIRGQKRSGVVLIEEFLRGEEFSVETVSFRGRTTVLGVTDKSLVGYPRFIESALMHPADIADETARRLQGFVCEALTAVGYGHGLAHTEVKLSPDGPRLVEINARMGGSYLFDLVQLVTGVDLFEVLIDLSLDRAPRATPGPTGIKSAAVHFLLPPRGGRIVEVGGVEEVKADPAIHRLVVDDVIGKTVREPEDNNDFIGHVIAVDRTGRGARRKAEWAFDTLAVRME